MKIAMYFLAFALLIGGWRSVTAHEYWMLAQPISAVTPQVTNLSIHVGTNFDGEQLPFTSAYITRLQQFSCGQKREITSLLPQTGTNNLFEIPFGCGGSHLFALDSHPNLITLPADKFTAYLLDEGLDDILKLRESTATTTVPGRERYRRHVKALLQAGPFGDTQPTPTTSSKRTEQTLEIVPVGDVLAQTSDSTMSFRVFFKGMPLDQKLVKAWYRHAGQTMIIRARTDRDGRVNFNLPYAGPWMLSTVHMIASTGTANVDWDSFWGNLTFDVSKGRTPGLSPL